MLKSCTNRGNAMVRGFVALLLVLMVLLGACAIATAEGAGQPKTGLSPTTGLPTDKPYRPILVIVSNSAEARPPWNLSEADIVYESIIWGPGHTRYAAIYNDNHPEKVGGIRSGRYYHEIIRSEWDCPFAVYGTSGTLPDNNGEPIGARVPGSFMFDATRTGPYSNAYSRDPLRFSPHNAVANLDWMIENSWPDDPNNAGQPYSPRAPLFQFSETPTRGEQTVEAIEIHYEETTTNKPNYLAAYVYNPETRAYDRSYCGYPQTDAESGKRITANNVIVQYCVTGYYNNQLSRPVINLTGEGPMDAYIDGTRIQGSWKRDSLEDQTQFYDESGEALKLMPGKTFIQIIPTSYGYDYDEETGLCRYAPDID